jgi:hypothetical protein
MAVSFFFTTRSVNKLYLLKGGNSIGLVTDGIFGRPFIYTFNLPETDFKSTRRQRKAHISFKNKRHYFYFLLNNVDGIFHEKLLFDHFICTQR